VIDTSISFTNFITAILNSRLNCGLVPSKNLRFHFAPRQSIAEIGSQFDGIYAVATLSRVGEPLLREQARRQARRKTPTFDIV